MTPETPSFYNRMIRITLSVMLLWMLFPATITAGCGDNKSKTEVEVNEFQSKIPSALMLPLNDVQLCEGNESNNPAASLICSLIPLSDSGCLTQAKALLQTDRHTGSNLITGLLSSTETHFSKIKQETTGSAVSVAFLQEIPPGSRLLRAPPSYS